MRDEHEHVVVHASAVLDLLVNHKVGPTLESRLHGCTLHAPGHIDVEVSAGLERLAMAGLLTTDAVRRLADTLAVAPIERHSIATLLSGAWQRRSKLPSVPVEAALYVELASTLHAKLVTTDAELVRASPASELVG
jgi:predicted nucleic acid-binding protein